jgi:hypothetical protein
MLPTATPPNANVPWFSRKNSRFSGKNRLNRVRLICCSSASTWAKSVLTVRSALRFLVTAYLTSRPTAAPPAVGAAADRVDGERDRIPAIEERVEDERDDVVPHPHDRGVAAHLGGDQPRHVAVPAAEGHVDVVGIERDPGFGALRRQLAVARLELTERQTRVTTSFHLQRTLLVASFDEEARTRPALRHWLSRPPAERIAAVEFLRRQVDGTGTTSTSS